MDTHSWLKLTSTGAPQKGQGLSVGVGSRLVSSVNVPGLDDSSSCLMKDIPVVGFPHEAPFEFVEVVIELSGVGGSDGLSQLRKRKRTIDFAQRLENLQAGFAPQHAEGYVCLSQR
jgi:hypothetical protein